MRIKHLNRFRTRRAERAPMKAAVSFRNRDGEISYGWSRDISLGGVYVHTDDRERLGTLCELGLTIRRPGGVRRLTVRGQAARHDAEGIAFQFCDLPDEARDLIGEILEEYLKGTLGDEEDATADVADAASGTAKAPAPARADTASGG
jgi:hypothetical protein